MLDTFLPSYSRNNSLTAIWLAEDNDDTVVNSGVLYVHILMTNTPSAKNNNYFLKGVSGVPNTPEYADSVLSIEGFNNFSAPVVQFQNFGYSAGGGPFNRKILTNFVSTDTPTTVYNFLNKTDGNRYIFQESTGNTGDVTTGSFYRIDPISGAIVQTIPKSDFPSAARMAFQSGMLWVPTGNTFNSFLYNGITNYPTSPAQYKPSIYCFDGSATSFVYPPLFPSQTVTNQIGLAGYSFKFKRAYVNYYASNIQQIGYIDFTNPASPTSSKIAQTFGSSDFPQVAVIHGYPYLVAQGYIWTTTDGTNFTQWFNYTTLANYTAGSSVSISGDGKNIFVLYYAPSYYSGALHGYRIAQIRPDNSIVYVGNLPWTPVSNEEVYFNSYPLIGPIIS